MSAPVEPAPRTPGAFDRQRPARTFLSQVTNRWTPLILAELGPGPRRFAALNAAVEGISHKVLAENLQALVRAGLVLRHQQPTVPPQVSYELTDLGRELNGSLCHFLRWINDHTEELVRAQHQHDVTGSPETVATEAFSGGRPGHGRGLRG